MGRRFLITVVAIALVVAGVATTADASPGDEYTGTHFGVGNLPDGCAGDRFDDPDNACYHMRTGMNGLDSNDVDVLLMVPASPTAARDLHIMRQAVDMWQGGIHYLAPQMGVPWMTNMRFHTSTDIEQPSKGLATYPIWDPEIVVVVTNPIGGLGIGIDPYATGMEAIGQNGNFLCHGVTNPFDLATWQAMPGYSQHGSERGGTVTEDCGGAGGNICFAINTAIDPTPPDPDVFNLFDLVSHEFGHCLTIGHVGDGSEGPWSKVPTNDIMSYDADPPGLNKCVSTLDVESIAVTQSHYIDANGDGLVNARDHRDANQKKWDATKDHFQVQHPRDHFYASSTGSPMDCPQPDLALIPSGTRTKWQPHPKPTSTNQLTITSPADGARVPGGTVHVRGSVAHVRTDLPPVAKPPPRAARQTTETVEFRRKGGNRFAVQDSSLGMLPGGGHTFHLEVPLTSNVDFTLSFPNPTALSDLDFTVSGSGYDSGSSGSTQSDPEKVRVNAFSGALTIVVDPFLIANPSGVDYTLRAVLSPPKAAAPALGAGATTRPVREHVRVYVDDNTAWAAHADVDTIDGPANFDIGMFVPRGTHTLRVEWDRFGKVVATKSLRVTA